MSRRRQSNGNAGAGFGVLLIIALLWWLRWLILAAVVVTVLVLITQRLMRGYAQRRSAELARRAVLRQRAEIENAQVLRGDPHGFFGHYPLPEPELIPPWYQADWPEPGPWASGCRTLGTWRKPTTPG